MKLGEITLRIPVRLDYESDDREYAVGGWYFVVAEDPELVASTLDNDAMVMLAKELRDGDFWAGAALHRFVDPSIADALTDTEMRELGDRINNRWVGYHYVPEPDEEGSEP
ncbi:hypothetical protein [Agromyces sp. NBRC 114283]|uniref:hypothetical protein n=1 Tax=Agromyces sp. NBRC 114283 TaxID=2994521 RepID=UPI0024A092D3|nr:hypothetical protein [Agromyces sp. NBRC 114283]GLU91332.1 hypothetical protein Agsp01_35870 [Agromyces sp. NBRC 114283]